MELDIFTLDDFDFAGKTVLLRPDINSPIDHASGELADDNRIRKSIPTIRHLAEAGARVVMLAHQGDIEDYRSLVDLAPHAVRLSELLQRPVSFVDDICGPAAVGQMKKLGDGQLLLLNNVRYLTEEVSTFVNYVSLTPQQVARTRLVRNLAPHADVYVSDAIAAAHRFTPSLVGLAEVLPAAAGRLFVDEYRALFRVRETPRHPAVFVLGGSRIADAFSMMERVLSDGKADHILTGGLTGEVMLMAEGYQLGDESETLIHEKGLVPYVARARDLLDRFADKILYPVDVGVAGNSRRTLTLDQLPAGQLLVDIGAQTIERYVNVIGQAETIFFNGPVGIYEKPGSQQGTERLLRAIAAAPGYAVIGGGDSVAAAGRFGVREQIDYVCTSGGSMVRFLSGQALPVVEALKRCKARSKEAGP